MEFFPFQLMFGLIVGLIAKSKGRNGLGWGIFGVLLHVVALVVVVLISNLNDPEARRLRAERAWEKERRATGPADPATARVEPQPLARTWGEAGVPSASRRPAPAWRDEPWRPDAPASEDPPAAAPRPVESTGLPPKLPEQQAPLGDERAWYFEENGRARGPEPESSVRKRLVHGELSPDTLVWAAGMDEWAPADTRAEFLA